MTIRILPPSEWSRLEGTELDLARPFLPTEDTQVLVVEQDGVIVGCWAVIRYVHVEGLWIHPDHRRRGRVLRWLLTGMQRVAGALGVKAVLTAAVTDEVRALILGAGGTQLPGDHYVLPIGGI